MLGQLSLALRLTILHEWRERARTMLILAAIFSVLFLMMGQGSREDFPQASAFIVALVAPFACATLPASAIDESASGFVRLMATQPLPRGAYVVLRLVALATILLAPLLPLVLALAALEGTPMPLAGGALALAVLWSVASALLLGLLARGPGSATGVWVTLCIFNTLAVLATAPGMRMDDVLVRARHALPGPSAIEMLTVGYDPWLTTAAGVLALQATLAGAAAVLYAAKGWRHAERPSMLARTAVGVSLVGALLLPFLLPAAPGGTR